MDGNRTKRCTYVSQYIWLTFITLTVGCTVLDPATLEGRWRLRSVVARDSSSVHQLTAAVVTLLCSGGTIEFRTGKLLIPRESTRDTLRMDYHVRLDTLVLDIIENHSRVRLRIARLDEDQLQLEHAPWTLLFYRHQ
jgi:hypothetical protein